MDAKIMLRKLSTCGVPMMIDIYYGGNFLPDATMVIGKPVEPYSDYLTFMHEHVSQVIMKRLGQPDTIVYTKNNEFIYYLWKIE